MADLIPESSKSRAIAHLNKDHKDDLQDMLQHFNKLPASKTNDPTVYDMNLSSLMLCTGDGATHIIRIDPPMATWDDRRQRLTEMTMEARKGLGNENETTPDSDPEPDSVSPIIITEYRSPSVYDFFVGVAVLAYFTSYTMIRLGLFTPTTEIYQKWAPYSTMMYNTVDKLHPGGVEWFTWLVQYIFYVVLFIHIAEVITMDRIRLSRYGVKRFTLVWFKWMTTTFFEGYMAFMRIDGLVEELEAEKKKKQ
ncbi:hypothetical protein QBC37DRAFT_423393 [Rhypophila decipiens]|uniref:DUF2470 domain-containing protein n=1 Tax=Rhypophila decipiens TaxID=261697 RepID=A0AAN6Y6U9_9PEZI|nr:hypothetical protein QBC37DRAFT_423393 [Rhypophila decipiens]